MEKELRRQARGLLESGQVGCVIGYEAGSVPFKSTPLFAGMPEEAERLVFNPTCVNNLSVYLPRAATFGKVAVVLKPCDYRGMLVLLQEHQIARENVIALLVSCPGVLARDALHTFNLREIRSVSWEDGSITVTDDSGKAVLPGEGFARKCLACDIDQQAADIRIGPAPERQPAEDRKAAVSEYEQKTPAERRAFWAGHFARCLRCYACRGVCPGCYCRECFVDKAGQMWLSKDTGPAANWFFHMTRAFHQAGRCTGCGECERVCPARIPLSLLNTRLALDVEAMLGAVPGGESEASVLGSFSMDDPDPLERRE
ncbi:MAG: 4Fe-4S dicluster domain-containing protein [Armatimonadetes bacterium]|nr:4Fe-4S dicluster domain-containing protein [Armatimonadota bacterium]